MRYLRRYIVITILALTASQAKLAIFPFLWPATPAHSPFPFTYPDGTSGPPTLTDDSDETDFQIDARSDQHQAIGLDTTRVTPRR